MIGMANSRGAWSDCLGMTVDDCKDILSSSTGDGFEIVIIEAKSEVSSTFQQNRIQIFVDESGIVNAIPKYG